MPGEQSNTSLIVGDAVVKFFRRLEPGMNPDVELLVGLSREGCEHIVPVRGWVGYEDYVLAIAQDYLTDAEDAWEVATRASTPALAPRARTAPFHPESRQWTRGARLQTNTRPGFSCAHDHP